jgi:glycosidase
MVYYVAAIGIDGFRCDVGDDVPEDFWAEGRRRIRLIKPEAILLNEGSIAGKLGICFDAMYAFGWHTAIHEIFAGNKDATFLYDRWLNLVERMSIRGGGVGMRDIDNHDTVTDWEQRSEVLGGHDGMELAEVLTFLIDGMPMVYCGNELADEKRISMFANRFHMGDFEVTDRDDKNSEASLRRQQIIKKLNSLRKQSVTLARGETKWIDNEKKEAIVSFKRVLNGEVYYVLGNMSRNEVSVTLSGISGEVIMESKMERNGDNFNFEPFGYMVLKGEE